MKSYNASYILAAASAVGAAVFPFYIELAVGVIDPPGGPFVGMELVVLVVGLVGAALVRFRAGGMARVLAATALAQAVIGVLALIVLPAHPASPPLEVLGVTGVFAALFAGSSLLFRRAARRHPSAGAGSGG